jgi:hypothetical protein
VGDKDKRERLWRLLCFLFFLKEIYLQKIYCGEEESSVSNSE